MTDLNQHRLKFSIDIHSIKEHSFRGLLYAHYSHYPTIGIKQQFRTAPVLEVTKPFVEMTFTNSFASYIFEANKEQLQQAFDETELVIELYHQDRLKKDQLIGIANIKLSELLKSPIRKSAKSYARAMDAYYPIDEIVDDDVKRIGLLRCICYLEDLGPIDQLQQQEQQTIEQITDPALPIINYPSSDDPEKQQVILELHSLEHKVIWELDTWKKSEEAKFRVQLKQKEYDLTLKLYSEFKQKELERERQFKQALAAIQVIENKIKTKGNDLLKREQKIIQLEEEVKQKLLETAKIIKQKDEEMGLLIKKQKDEKLSFEKEKTIFNLKLIDAQGMVQKMEEENKNLKKEMDKSPVAMVKTTLQEKTQEINDLKKELERTNQIKEQYKQYYEKMRDELIKQKQLVQDNTFIQQQNTNSELERLRNELQEMKARQYLLTNQQNTQQIKQFSNESEQKEMQQPQQSYQPNIFQQQNQTNIPKKQQQGALAHTSKPQSQTTKKSFKEYPDANIQSDLQRLLQEREYLIESGEYEELDPLIKELTKQIQELGGD